MGAGVADGGRNEDRAVRSRLAVAATIGGGLVAVAFAAAWIERAPIVAHFVDRRLADEHVVARYRITGVGPIAQRLEDVSIGDPRAPDLTAHLVELRLGYDRHGPHLAAIRADGVRLSARVVEGRLSLGALDRLVPAGGTGPVDLPDIALALTDARATVATPAGTIRLAADGAGRLPDGFRGTLALDSPALTAGGCTVATPRARLAVRVDARRPFVSGPLAATAVTCGNGVRLGAGRAEIAIRLAATLDRWSGDVAPAGFAGRAGGLRFGALAGRIGVTGSRRRIAGAVRLAASGIASGQGAARGARVDGQYRFAPGVSGLVYAGDVGLDGARIEPALRRRIGEAAEGVAATPVGPPARAMARSVAALLADADVAARVAVTVGGPAGAALKVRRLTLSGRSGGVVRLTEGAGIGRTVREPGWRLDGRVSIAGGGLPSLDAVVTQARAGGPVAGLLRAAPYGVRGGRIALTPVRFTSDGAATRIATTAAIDGPLGTGRIDGLTVPIEAHVDARGFAVGGGCAAVGFRRVAFAGVTLAPTRVRLCGLDGAPIVAGRGGIVRAGASLGAGAIAGTSSGTPLALRWGAARVTMSGFTVEQAAVRLGTGDAESALDVATLDGRFAAPEGRFAGGVGRIAHVPLRLGAAAGTWRVGDDALRIDADATVSDASDPARLKPLAAQAIALTWQAGRVAATARLAEPATGIAVATVALHHDLASGRGGATIGVPGLVFDRRLQPEMLTPVTLGVVANVAGTVTGSGRIDWTPAGVTSSGDFATDRIDLAAAFGPATGIAGHIHFSDLLGLATPPGQVAHVGEVNPGIAVSDGVVRYQLLPGQKVAVEGARWPFAGGTLTLAPSVLTFGQASERTLTFRLAALDAAAFVQQLAFPNLAATGTFDGVLPMVFDDRGGRIAGGTIVARAPGGKIAYIGQLSNEKLGTMGKLTFDALKAIRYSSLSIGLDGRLDGEIVSHVAFQGVRQATADSGIVARMIRNLPFRFNIAVRAPFRALLGTARSYVDPSLLLQGGGLVPGDTVNVAPQPSIQPVESEPVR